MTHIVKRSQLNVEVGDRTRADLRYLAEQHDTNLTEEVRMAIQWRALVERLIESGAKIVVRADNKEYFLMTPGYSGTRAFDRAELLAKTFTASSLTKTT